METLTQAELNEFVIRSIRRTADPLVCKVIDYKELKNVTAMGVPSKNLTQTPAAEVDFSWVDGIIGHSLLLCLGDERPPQLGFEFEGHGYQFGCPVRSHQDLTLLFSYNILHMHPVAFVLSKSWGYSCFNFEVNLVCGLLLRAFDDEAYLYNDFRLDNGA